MEPFAVSRTRRWLALAALLANAAFNYVYPILPLGLADMRTAAARYPSPFAPAGYAFSIWGVIYAGWLAYLLHALSPKQRGNILHERLCGPLALLNVLASAWIVEFAGGFVGLAQLLIVVMLVAGAAAWFRARAGSPSLWVRAPFGVFFGWITVANLANLAAWLSAAGWGSGNPASVTLALALLAVAVAAAGVMALRYGDFVFPAVVAWAAGAIGVAQSGPFPVVGTAAYAAAAVTLAAAAFAAARAFARPRGMLSRA